MCTTFVAFQMVNKFLQISTDGPTDRQSEIITYCRRKRRHVQSEYAQVCVAALSLSLFQLLLLPTLVIMWIRLNCRSVLCVIILFRAIRLE